MVRIIAISTLRHFWEINRDAEEPIKAWYQEARAADWATPHQVKAMYRNASVLGDNRVVFNISGTFDSLARTPNTIGLTPRKSNDHSSCKDRSRL